jgi:hypothetical protein
VALRYAHGWIVLHPSGAYVTFTQAGATCSRSGARIERHVNL